MAAGLGRFLASLTMSFFGNILARFGLVCQTLQALALVASIQGGQSSARSGMIWMAGDEERKSARETIEYRIDKLWKAVPDKDTLVTVHGDKGKLTVVPRALKLFVGFKSSPRSPGPPLLFTPLLPTRISSTPFPASLSILLLVGSPLLYSTPCSALIVSPSLHSHPLHFCLPPNSIFSATLCLSPPPSSYPPWLSLTIFRFYMI